MKNGSRRGLFHPDDIQRFTSRPSLQDLSLDLTPTKLRPQPGKHSRPGASPLTPPPASAPILGQYHPNSQLQLHPMGSFGRADAQMYSGPASAGTQLPTGSFGRAELKKTQSELDRYTEGEDEDYEDVFGKPGSNGMPFPFLALLMCLMFGVSSA